MAIEVPEARVPWLPVPIAVERMLTPGAVMSGLSALSPPRGPFEVKLASAWKPGLAMTVFVAVAVPPCAAARSLPSVAGAPRIPKKGIVTSTCSPVSGFSVILPSKGG